MSVYYHGTTEKSGLALLDGIPNKGEWPVWNMSASDKVYLHKRHRIIQNDNLYDKEDKLSRSAIENIVLEEPYFHMAMACAAANGRGELTTKGIIIKYWVDDKYVEEDGSFDGAYTFEVSEMDLFEHGVVIGWYELEFNPWFSMYYLLQKFEQVYQGAFTEYTYNAIRMLVGTKWYYDLMNDWQSASIENAEYHRRSTKWPYTGKPYSKSKQ